MNKIYTSLVVITIMATSVIGGTTAYFSDTEVSTDNVFTAGSIDLKINHTAATYNGENCVESCDQWAVDIVSFDQGKRKNGTDVLTNRRDPNLALGPADTTGTNYDPSPTGFVSLGFGGRIILGFPNGIYDGPGPDLRIYEATGAVNYASETITVEVSVDGIDFTSIPVSPSEITFDGTVEIDINGQAPTVYFVRITDVSDPAIHGLLDDGYDLDAVEALHCNGGQTAPIISDIWQCQLWEAKDLENEKFFNFSDIKPQDQGSNLISMRVSDNEAYLCLMLNNKEELENTHTEPEIAAGDSTPGTLEGELGSFLTFAGWYSDELGNKGDLMFGPEVADTLEKISYADSLTTTKNPLVPGEVEHALIEWCFGDMTIIGTEMTCDGNVANVNQAQTDAFLADLQFYAVQTRNNSDFSCANIVLPNNNQ